MSDRGLIINLSFIYSEMSTNYLQSVRMLDNCYTDLEILILFRILSQFRMVSKINVMNGSPLFT